MGSPISAARPTASSTVTRGPFVPALFTTAIFVAAALLFVVQPMVGKMVLPRVGGSPQVWNTSLVFFQTALLMGYLYAHLTVRWLGARRQALFHLLALLLPFIGLPIALPDSYPPMGGAQSPWILAVLTLSVGAPFFVMASASPLLQSWLAATDHETSDDPYFLYAGSNAGSLVGLLAFPLLLEPRMGLTAQSRLWMMGYVLFIALAAACVVVVSRAGRSAAAPAPGGVASTPASGPAPPRASEERGSRPVTTRDRLFWIAAAAVPSALLLGVTQYLTTHISPISILWVIPLAVYLATFIAAFARWRIVSEARLSRLLAIPIVIVALVQIIRFDPPDWTVAITCLHLIVLGAAALLCHMRLADARPPTAHLTEYYLWISTGGAIGGTLSALIAPVAFDFIAEYPIALAAACLFRLPFAAPSESRSGVGRFIFQGRTLDFVLPVVLTVYLFSAAVASRTIPSMPDGLAVILIGVVPTMACFLMAPRPVRFTLAVSVVLAAAESGQMYRGEILHAERTFFGVHRVVTDPGSNLTILYHGTTVHGVQSRDPERATEPLAYYHSTGPAGSLIAAAARTPEKERIALVGAGTGALAVLAGPHQTVTLFEIDPEVVYIAEESGYFTYVENSPATIETVVGDGRLALARDTTRYDVIVLDAFSSGTIPVHLLTREAFELYLERLSAGGVLLFHISNVHLDLAPLLATQARDVGLPAWEWIDARVDVERGLFGSQWVLMARRPEDVSWVPRGGWRPMNRPPLERGWTDDFSDLLAIQRWTIPEE